MLNVVSLLPHCKKDSKVESKESKGATLNELVEVRNCSSCLFFEVQDQSFYHMLLAHPTICMGGTVLAFGEYHHNISPLVYLKLSNHELSSWKHLRSRIFNINGGYITILS